MKITEYEQVWSIWQESNDKLHAYLLSRFKKKELAEEATQEVLLKMHRACCSDKEINNLNSWLFQIAHNTALDIIKKGAKRDEIAFIPEDDEVSDSYSELTHFLIPLIDFLPEKYSTPLRMSDIDGVPQSEIAERLGLGLSATKSRIQRARKLLKKEISTCFHLQVDKNGAPIQATLKDCCEPLVELKKNTM